MKKINKREFRYTLVSLIKFAVVGGCNTLIHYLTIFLLSKTYLSPVAYSVGYTLAAVNSFVANKYWTFRQKSHTDINQISKFVVTNIISCIVGNVFFEAFSAMFAGGSLVAFMENTDIFGKETAIKLLGFIVTMPFTTLINYSFNRFWVFSGKNTKENKKEII